MSRGDLAFPAVRRRAQIFGWSLIWCGLLVFGYVSWQLVITDFMNGGVQAREQVDLLEAISDNPLLGDELHPAEVIQGRPLPPETPPVVNFTSESAVEEGESFAIMRIPKIGVEHVVFGGVSTKTLKLGPGHMRHTPVPGQPGNSVISGHRTTYGSPFHDLDQLRAGDRIEVETRSGLHVYEVRESQVVAPNAWWVTDERPGAWLTLTTCHPKFSARQRLVVWAEMVGGPNFDYVRLTTVGA